MVGRDPEGRSPLTRMFNYFLLSVLVVLGLSRSGDAARPVFEADMNYFVIREDATIGSSVYTLRAYDPADRSRPVTYALSNADMLSVNRNTGVLTLTRALDYEGSEFALQIQIIARDYRGVETKQAASVNVIDVNDNSARFTETSYDISVREDVEVGYIVFDNLSVKDVDLVNSPLNVTCDTSSVDLAFKESCNIFSLKRLAYSNKDWRGQIILSRKLDYEQRSSHQLSLKTHDGDSANDATQSFEIQVIDVNDAPPYFIRQVPSTVSENTTIGSVVNFVEAVDGDKNNRREIRYNLTCTDGKYFSVDYVTGEVRSLTVLNRENPDLSQGYVDLCIRASELINKTTGEIGNTPSTTASTIIRINIRDENDNAPSFNKNSYTVDIYENIPNQSALPGLIMTVTDKDIGTANFYAFKLLNHNDVFAIFPDEGQATTTASIKVIDTSKIDYEVGPRKYLLQINAVETQTVNPKTGSVIVTVNVLDVNDNIPVFNPPNYSEQIREDAVGGTKVVTVQATDADNKNVSNIAFSLVGNGADKFQIDRLTGLVTVKDCPTPGQKPCIDYEDRREYQLTVKATDNNGTGRESTASLIVTVLNVNDNKPVFKEISYLRYINEQETNPIDSLIISTTDPDDPVGAPTTYSLVGPDARYWQISNTGRITARSPINYNDATNGAFRFLVQADNAGSRPNTVFANVTIIVIDQNNYPPEFEKNIVTESIREDSPGLTNITQLVATDGDSPTSKNGQFEFSIVNGSRAKFEIDRKTGMIRTTNDATFDFDIQRTYSLIVLARDGGKPQRTGTTTVVINIVDVNNKLPYFEPMTQRFSISENSAIGDVGYTVKARDPDDNPVLFYKFEGPKTAITPQGTAVDINNYDFGSLFTIDSSNGRVIVAKKLDRDRSSVLTYQMIIEDRSASNQSGTGTLIITITEYNDMPPQFEKDVYDLTIDEERIIGSFVTTLIANDQDDNVNRYEMVDNGMTNYFKISPDTGVVSVDKRMDYEVLNSTEFTVRAYDDGDPILTATARVRVTIRNINDNSPRFQKDTYSVEVREQIGRSDVLLQVSANDLDLGDFGEVRYKLDSREAQFEIDEMNGNIRLRQGQELDREKESIVAVQVTAYDSPNTPSVRREYTIPVYFIITDVNDNKPQFTEAEYFATIIETIVVGAEVLPIVASDLDIDLNAALAFFKGDGESDNYFRIGRNSGKVIVNKSLIGHSGQYIFFVEVRDLDGRPGYSSNTARVTITVLKATNSPPRWVLPPYANMTIEVLESQYLGMLVYDAHAEDDDDGKSGNVEYGFVYNNSSFTNQTKEFHINRVTGVIRAEIVYDREQVDSYLLQLVARDQDDNPQSTTRFLTVKILDVNDNKPRFPMANGVMLPYNFDVQEGSTPNTLVGAVTAIDADLAEYSKVHYFILAGNELGNFRINEQTGEIFVNKMIDREEEDSYILYIQATNNVSDYSVIRYRREIDPSMTTVRINVADVNDVAPSFIYPTGSDKYHGCISVDAAYGQSVIQVSATDSDSGGPASITYSITGGNDDNVFFINPNTGMISNINLLNRARRVYMLTIQASDGVNKVDAKALIFVTSSDNEVSLLINQPASEVRLSRAQLIRTLSSSDGVDYVCITDIRDHVQEDGSLSTTATDVKVTGVVATPPATSNNDFTILSSADHNSKLAAGQAKNKREFDAMYIDEINGGAGPASASEIFFDRTPVLVVFIIIILLILLAIILFCLACCCIRESKKRQKKKYHAEHGYIGGEAVPVAEVAQPVDIGKSVNPVYDNSAFVPGPAVGPEPVDEPDPAVFTPSTYTPVHSPIIIDDDEDDDDDGPVIVTTIQDSPVRTPSPVPEEPEPTPEDPEPVIETTIMEEPNYPPPPPSNDSPIETVIVDESNPPSPEIKHTQRTEL